MTSRIQRWDQHRHMAWANGAGSTAEIARSPAEGDFDWRLSIADVSGNGPFSSLPGVDRIIVNLGDVGMVLTVDGRPSALERFVPYAFDGGAHTTCEVSGPTRDLNLMTRRGRASGNVVVRRLHSAAEVRSGQWMVVLDGEVHAGTELLTTGDAIRPGDHDLALNGHATIAVIAVS